MAVKIEACVSEFVGTFFLVLTIGYNVLQRTALAPISIGAMLTAMIFATGKVSGGHFNPAVTLGVLLRGKVNFESASAYVGSQLCGALLAGCVYSHILGATFSLGPGTGYTLAAAAIVEVLFTAALVFVVLSVATTAQDDGNWYYGLAIGFTVMAAAFAIGPISGCSLNPAVTVGVIISHLMHTGEIMPSRLLTYTVAPLLGSLVAVLLFNMIRNAEYEVPLPNSTQSSDLEYIAQSLAPQTFSSAPLLPKRPDAPPGYSDRTMASAPLYPSTEYPQYSGRDPRTGLHTLF
jgi:aquaporin Z